MDEDGLYLVVQTNQSHLQIAEAARTQVFCAGQRLNVRRHTVKEQGFIAQELEFDLERGNPITIEKLVGLYTSRDHAITECGIEAKKAVQRVGRFSV